MSVIRVNSIQTAAGVDVYTIKAWVTMSVTAAILDSGNISSTVDTSVSQKTINFTNSFATANYNQWASMHLTAAGAFNDNLSFITKATGSIILYHASETNVSNLCAGFNN
jgi:hypothetical protein